jgi:hypothetical protein
MNVKTPAYSPIDYARFWAKVEIPAAPRHENLCWNWKGSTAKDYGQIKIDGVVLRAHRVAFEMFYGPLEDEAHVLHSCDNPLCVNPKHIRSGTHQENMDDKRQRGRTTRDWTKTVFG